MLDKLMDGCSVHLKKLTVLIFGCKIPNKCGISMFLKFLKVLNRNLPSLKHLALGYLIVVDSRGQLQFRMLGSRGQGMQKLLTFVPLLET